MAQSEHLNWAAQVLRWPIYTSSLEYHFWKKTNCEFTSIFGFFMGLQIHILRYRAGYSTDPTKLVPANYDPTALATKFNFKTEKYSVKWLIHFVFFYEMQTCYQNLDDLQWNWSWGQQSQIPQKTRFEIWFWWTKVTDK